MPRARIWQRRGNPNQWEPGYPTDEVLRGDMARGGLHVLADDTGIYGAFAFLTGDDPTYAEIDGAWLSDRPYATIHRVASDGTHRGVFAEVMAFAMAMQPHLRIDTHALNLPMQRQIEPVRVSVLRRDSVPEWGANGV